MPTSAYALLILGLFGIAWLVIAWRSLLPRQGRPAVPPKVPRLLKPRTPLDCPACCSPTPDPTLPAPVRAPVRPWREIKSRRGAPKRISTQGFACPMPTCPYYQITDAHVHALVGDGSHGTGECFSLKEFFRRVSMRERTDLPDAIFHARVVIEVLGEAVSPGEMDDVLAQLPAEFDRLFEAGSMGNMPAAE